MTAEDRKEIERELEAAQLMVKDLQKLWNSYAKKALLAKQERELKQAKIGFMNCETVADLIELYGYGEFDDETYRRGIDYFEGLKKPPTVSVVEQHRANIKKLLDNWKGTVSELKVELNPIIKQPEETIFERLERKEREERYQSMI